MKHALLAILLVLTCACFTQAGGDYNEGWAQGWKAGWKQIEGPYAFPPFSPFPPFPPSGQCGYQDGFAAGVLAGAQAAQGH